MRYLFVHLIGIDFSDENIAYTGAQVQRTQESIVGDSLSGNVRLRTIDYRQQWTFREYRSLLNSVDEHRAHDHVRLYSTAPWFQSIHSYHLMSSWKTLKGDRVEP